MAPLLLRNNGHPGRLARTIFFTVAILSFCLCLFLVAHDRSAAFFLLPSRAWELLIGALLALGAIPEIRSGILRQWAALSGLLLILAAAGAINRNTAFPGWAALAPCLGAALIIHSGSKGDTPIYRLLSSKGFVFVGLISYSLYLWHWPLIVFYKASFGYPSYAAMALLGAVSLVVAAISWRYVETPFRKRTRLVSRKYLFSTAALTSGAAVAIAVFFVATEGLSYRYPESLRRLAGFRYDPTPAMREGTCFISRAFSHTPSVDPSCLHTVTSRRNVLLVGDSHAAHYWAGLAKTFTHLNFLQATASGCTPILEGGGAARCRSVIDAAYQDYIPNRQLDAVILAANWSRKDVPGLLETVGYLSKYVSRIYVFGPIVAYNDLLPRLLTRSEMLSDPTLLRQLRVSTTRLLDKEFADAFASGSTRYVSIYDILCDGRDDCVTKDHHGLPIQFDKAHLTETGSIIVARALRERGFLQFNTLTSER